jgi:hypothetical protein
MYRILRICLLTVLVVSLTAICFADSAVHTKRIAILPIIDQTGQLGTELGVRFAKQLQQEFYVPLNGTLKAVEFIPQEKSMAVLGKINRAASSIPGKKAQQLTQEKMKLLADDLQADVTVGLVVYKMYEVIHPDGRDGDMYMESGVGLRLIGYDRKNDRFINTESSDYYLDEYEPAGTVSELSKNTMSRLFQQAELKKCIFPLSETK